MGGIVSEPEGGVEAAMLLLGGHGRPARSGVNSFWARTSRRLAREGVLVLRIDYSREGETLPIGEGKGGLRWKHDLDLSLSAQAAAWLRERVDDDTPFVFAGVCAGARLAIELAGRDPRLVAGAFLVVPYLKDLATIERRLEAGDAGVDAGTVDPVDPLVVECARRVLLHAPVWALVGERDDSELPELQRCLGPNAHRELEVEVVLDAALHLLDQPGLQSEVGDRLVTRIARISTRANLRAR